MKRPENHSRRAHLEVTGFPCTELIARVHVQKLQLMCSSRILFSFFLVNTNKMFAWKLRNMLGYQTGMWLFRVFYKFSIFGYQFLVNVTNVKSELELSLAYQDVRGTFPVLLLEFPQKQNNRISRSIKFSICDVNWKITSSLVFVIKFN
jgi:hypothetical protein